MAELLTIEKLVAGGAGLARTPQGVVFVDGVLPGEQVEVQIVEQQRDYRRAELLRVLTPSAARVSPPCPYYSRCGGCHWQHIDYRAQLQQKLTIVAETLRRATGSEQAAQEVFSADEWHYRSRFRLASDPQGRWGLRQRNSNRVLPLGDCLIARPAIARFLQQQGREAHPEGGPYPSRASAKSQSTGTKELHLSEDAAGNLAKGQQQLEWSYRQQRLTFQPEIFFQSNLLLLPQLLQWLAEKLDALAPLAPTAWDLYAGVGLFSKTILCQRFSSLIAVESAQASGRWLRHNLQDTKAQCQICRVEDFLARQQPGQVLALVDPPRSGLSASCCEQLLRLRPQALVYVSCDPASWARDLARLSPHYLLASWALFDFYPQNSQIELASILLPCPS